MLRINMHNNETMANIVTRFSMIEKGTYVYVQAMLQLIYLNI